MQILTADKFISFRRLFPVVDVRSPGEFAEGHISGAINIPIFNNEERAIVGTIYIKKGRLPAIEKGLEIVGPKMAQFVREAVELTSSGQLFVYCWRGGMRSESMAWLFERIGIKCTTLKGGYKAYRKYLLEKIGEFPHLIVIEGHTGSGKTEILKRLKKMGEQVIDLEGLANHKGSVFGGISQEPQPTTQQFQNDLFNEISDFDLSKRVWVEGEGLSVGRVFLPDPFWNKMNNAHCVEILVPRSDRIERLVSEYGTLQDELMQNAIRSLIKRLGEENMNEILRLYLEKDLSVVAGKLLEYYDQTYQFSRNKYKRKMTEIILPNGDASLNAKLILEKAAKIF
jgi:tRNA 2-selenouridine synthase